MSRAEHRSKPRFALLVFMLVSSGCLDAPKLRRCAEFPAGTAGCPTPCETYCELMVAACPETVAVGDAEPVRACLILCGERLLEPGEVGDTRGDTMACRTTYALRAQSDPAGNCRAAALEAGEACSDAGCDEYCEHMASACPATFPDIESCKATCEVYPRTPAGADPATPANTVECRVRAARNARSDAAACAAAAPSGGGTCGAPCAAYCDQIEAHCASAPVYPDRQTCETTCALLPLDDAPTAPQAERNTVECRLYHATYPAAFDPATHCPHTSVYHAAHCGPVCETYCGLLETHCPDTPAASREACLTACEAELGAGRSLWPTSDAPAPCE
jgi:hypothetical protein